MKTAGNLEYLECKEDDTNRGVGESIICVFVLVSVCIKTVDDVDEFTHIFLRRYIIAGVGET